MGHWGDPPVSWQEAMGRIVLYDSLEHFSAQKGEDNQAQRQLYRAILREGMKSQLTARQREAIQLYYLEGLTLDQVGRQLGISRSAACRRVQGARKRLSRFAKGYLALEKYTHS